MTITATRSLRRRSLLVAGAVVLGLVPSFVMQGDAKAEISNCGYVKVTNGSSITTVPLGTYCEGMSWCTAHAGPSEPGVGPVKVGYYECLRVNP